MKIKVLILCLLLLGSSGMAQDIICSAQDKNAFKTKRQVIDELRKEQFGETIVAVGKTFLGTPYVAKTLEVGEIESLVVNLQGLDCTTYVENVLAFSLMLKREDSSFSAFVETLEEVRYRDGKLDGYGSRLHYFTEWIANNEKKGLLKNVTAFIGGEQIAKEINFMSTHRDLYPFLESDENFEKIKQSEEVLKTLPIYVLRHDQLVEKEAMIASGDIIALATSIEGLDVTHTGIATREADGRIHLLHASSSGQVEISKLPLIDYLKKVSKNTGIIVARPY